ncbi:hypothetical protein VTO42DRAFT_7747 [Malbranchea cinnamomea]
MALKTSRRFLALFTRPVALHAPKRFSSGWANWQSNSQTLPQSISILTPGTSKLTHRDLVSHLPILPYTPETKNITPVILITPSFAPWIYDSPSLLQAVIGHIFREWGKLDKDADIYSMAAVVDRLPVPLSNTSPFFRSDTQSFSPQKQRGSEGLSLLFLERGSIIGSISGQLRSGDDFAQEPEPNFIYEATTSTGDISTRVRISTPVANTLFSTGQPHTLIAARWRFGGESELPFLRSFRDLTQCTVKWPQVASTIGLSVPLRRLTGPRRVIASMGNVLREISANDGTENGIPASSELEIILPKYVKDHNLQNQRLAVWALVTPDNLSDTDQSVETTHDILTLIARGARLHRVMGGGGGWGKRQGLLSLDPESSAIMNAKDVSMEGPIEEIMERGLGEREADGESFFVESADELPRSLGVMGKDSASPLPTVAKPGDLIQFFIAPLEHTEHATDHELEKGDMRAIETRIFGIVPAADNVPPPTEKPDGIIVLQNHFGVLSDKAVTFIALEQKEPTNQRQAVGTKIDVPGTRIIVGH